VGNRIAVVTLLALALGAPAAFACNVPDIAVKAEEAGPGDLVAFAISDTDAGASYTIYVDTEQVLSGDDLDGGGVTGSFKMPDLGDVSFLTAVEVKIVHPNPGTEAGNYHGRAPWWGSTADLRYVSPAEDAARSAPAVAAPAPVKRKGSGRPPRRRAARGARPPRSRPARPAPRARRTAPRRAPGRTRSRPPAERRGPAARAERRGAAAVAPELERPTRRAAQVRAVEPAGAGIGTAVLALSLLTVACAGYGFVGARRARAAGSSSTTGMSRSVRRW
jgi:hypothetical protein